jgi:hypothetical protein
METKTSHMDTIISNLLRLSILLWMLLACLAGEARAASYTRTSLPPCEQDMYATRGEVMANATPLSAELRSRLSGVSSRRGFDIGMGIAQQITSATPYEQYARRSLNPVEQIGFDIAVSFSLDRNKNTDLASWGAAVARVDPIVAEARTADPDVRYWLGFDIAAGIYGDPALGALGRFPKGPTGGNSSINDHEGALVRSGLSPIARKGFDGAVNLYWSRTRMGADGRPVSVTVALAPTAGFDEMAAKGEAIANTDPLSAALRNRVPGIASRRGFDIGMAAAEGNTLPGPGKQRIHDSLNPVEQIGFDIAVSFSLDRNRNADLASRGAAVANADPILSEARTADPDVRYWLGFEIATGIYGDPAQGGMGHFTRGPAGGDPAGSGQSTMDHQDLLIRNALDPIARKGFDGAVSLYWSSTRRGPDGRPISVTVALPPAPRFEELAAKGAMIATADPLSVELRNRSRDDGSRLGFDIGMAAAEGQTLPGPGKDAIYAALCGYEQDGFETAVSFSLQRNRNAQLAATGAAIANLDPLVAEARTTDPDVFYWLGFDIATGIFGDHALGALGNTAVGPGSLRIRDALNPNGQRGFNASVALHLKRKY